MAGMNGQSIFKLKSRYRNNKLVKKKEMANAKVAAKTATWEISTDSGSSLPQSMVLPTFLSNVRQMLILPTVVD